MTKWLQLKALFLCGVLMVCLLTSGYAAVEQDRGDGAVYGEKCSVFVDGRAEYTAYPVEGRVYVPLRSFCSSLSIGAVSAHSSAKGTMVAVFTDPNDPGRSCRLQARAGDPYLYLNDRIVYLGAEILYNGGNVLVPMDGLCRTFGLTPVAVAEGWAVRTDCLQIIADGTEVYDPEDLHWLSRIIHAEAGNQSLTGRVCVGNVVLNRVADSRFPDTVEAVIFSPKQFCPVGNGSIWCTPDAESMAAAKLCLEGINFAGSSTYFVNPVTGSTGWFRANLTFVMSVEDHDFYC